LIFVSVVFLIFASGLCLIFSLLYRISEYTEGATQSFEEECYFFYLDEFVPHEALLNHEGAGRVRRLTKEDGEVVDGTWKYRSGTSLSRIQDQIACRLSAGEA